MRVSEIESRQALDDGGRFFDAWAWVSESEWAWTAGELFDAPGTGRAGGLIWRLGGALVEAYGPEHVRLSDGRTLLRESMGARNTLQGAIARRARNARMDFGRFGPAIKNPSPYDPKD